MTLSEQTKPLRTSLHWRQIKDRLAEISFFLMSLVPILLVLAILLALYLRTRPILEVKPITDLLFGQTWKPLKGEFGFYPFILGTLWVTVVAMVLAVPPSLLTAMYLAEYARDTWLTRAIRLAIINLAGIPSIVYGLFGLGLFVLFLGLGTSIVAGSLTLGLMTMPVVISTAEEALLTVPQRFRVASRSLGATRWQTIRQVVLPNALPGILTGVILGLERAAGETAPILFTVAAF